VPTSVMPERACGTGATPNGDIRSRDCHLCDAEKACDHTLLNVRQSPSTARLPPLLWPKGVDHTRTQPPASSRLIAPPLDAERREHIEELADDTPIRQVPTSVMPKCFEHA